MWLACTRRGYGFFDGRGAHRVSWELATGEAPGKAVVCHSCDTPGCVNPDHLWLGTHADNVRDKKRKMRHSFGERSGTATISAEDVVRMRNLSRVGWRNQEIALAFGIPQATASAAITGKTWAHVPGPVPPQRGERHHQAKLSDAEVAEIRGRHSSGEQQVSLAREFGVSKSLVSQIVRGLVR